MAVRINKDTLTREQKDNIRKYLCIQPKQVGFFKKRRFSQAKDPIIMWHIDKPNNEVILPYTFGNKLLGKHINSQVSYPPGNFNFKGQLRAHQIPIVTQARQHLNTTGTTTLGVYPGCGKTIMSACLGSELGGLVLVVYPIKVVEPGWLNTFKQFTDATIWLNDGNTPMPPTCNVILTMDTQFHKIHPKILKLVRVFIIDEAHMFCVPSRTHCLLGVTPQYIIACSATLERRDGMEAIIQSVCGTHGIFLKSPKPFTVYRLFTGIKTEITLTKNGDANWSKLVSDLSEDPLRNSFIIDLVERNLHNKIMILTWNQSHVYLLQEILRNRGISVDILVGTKSTYKDSKVLIGTISKIGTGFDEAMACPDWGGERSNMLILTGSTKSLQGLEQFTGRVFRAEFPTIIDFVDDNRICKSHWTQRNKWYEDPGRNGQVFHVDMKKTDDNSEPKDITNNRIKAINHKSITRIKAKLNIVG